MPECNIGAKGRRVRFVGGAFTILASIIFAILLATETISLGFGWYLVVGLFIGGSFAIYEARAGCCIVRAMGIKTPL